MSSIIKFIKSEYNVIKLIFEIGIAGFSIYKILNWKNELTHIKKLENREKILEILLEIPDIYNSLVRDLQFLISPVFIYSQNKNEEYKIINERYKKIYKEIHFSNVLLNKFMTIFLNYFEKLKKKNEIIELYDNLSRNINIFNVNIHTFILICEKTYADIPYELSLQTTEIIQNSENIYDSLKIEKLNFKENQKYFKDFYSTLDNIINITFQIKNYLLNMEL